MTLIAAFPVLAAQGLTDQQLVVTHPIEVSGVQQGDTGVEGGVDSGDAFALVSRTVGSRHSTAAEPDGRDMRPGGAEVPNAHEGFLPSDDKKFAVSAARFDFCQTGAAGRPRRLCRRPSR